MQLNLWTIDAINHSIFCLKDIHFQNNTYTLLVGSIAEYSTGSMLLVFNITIVKTWNNSKIGPLKLSSINIWDYISSPGWWSPILNIFNAHFKSIFQIFTDYTDTDAFKYFHFLSLCYIINNLCFSFPYFLLKSMNHTITWTRSGVGSKK